jgi:hypothetical protein
MAALDKYAAVIASKPGHDESDAYVAWQLSSSRDHLFRSANELLLWWTSHRREVVNALAH